MGIRISQVLNLKQKKSFTLDLQQNSAVLSLKSHEKFTLNLQFDKLATQGFPPANITLPVISGTIAAGQILNVSDGTWSGEPASFLYQWIADGVDIPSATENNYELAYADEGKLISCKVIAVNLDGTAEVISLETSQVLNPLLGLNGLQLLLDASDESTISLLGGKVTQWNDKSTYGRNVSQNSDPYRPSFTPGDGFISFIGRGIELSAQDYMGLSSLSVFSLSTKKGHASYSNILVGQGNDGQNWTQRSSGGGGGTLDAGFKTVVNGSVNDGRYSNDFAVDETAVLIGTYDEVTGLKKAYQNGNLEYQTTLSGPIETDDNYIQVGSRSLAQTNHDIRLIAVFDNTMTENDYNIAAAYFEYRRALAVA